MNPVPSTLTEGALGGPAGGLGRQRGQPPPGNLADGGLAGDLADAVGVQHSRHGALRRVRLTCDVGHGERPEPRLRGLQQARQDLACDACVGHGEPRLRYLRQERQELHRPHVGFRVRAALLPGGAILGVLRHRQRGVLAGARERAPRGDGGEGGGGGAEEEEEGFVQLLRLRGRPTKDAGRLARESGMLRAPLPVLAQEDPNRRSGFAVGSGGSIIQDDQRRRVTACLGSAAHPHTSFFPPRLLSEISWAWTVPASELIYARGRALPRRPLMPQPRALIPTVTTTRAIP
eukprot:743522-Prorocentrum_minimum.AAC.5